MNEDKTTVIVSEDYTRAVTLTRSIIANAQAAQQSLYEVCKGLKEMRDGKLYKELGYQNFADYCENETGIKVSQAKKYVAIADHMTEETASQLAKISTEKLYMLAMLDEPTREAVTETIDVESVTVKELKAQIGALTAERDTAKASLESKDKQFREALEGKDKQIKAAQDAKENAVLECKTFLNGKIRELEARIQELQDQPITHDMTDADAAAEIERLKKELEDEQLRVMMVEKSAESKARLAAESVREEYERKLAEKSPETDENALDEARFNSFRLAFEDLVDQIENLLGTMHDDPRISYVNRLDNYWTDNLLYLKREGEGAGA